MFALHRSTAIGAAVLMTGAIAAPAMASPVASPVASPIATGATTVSSTSTLMAPPTGSVKLKAAKVKGVVYRRYKVTGMTPKNVSAFYATKWKAAGYTVHSGSGGGGWGPWGGAGAGSQGAKSGHYISVNAGARTGGPTYFEVCFGTDKKLVNNCQNLLQNNN